MPSVALWPTEDTPDIGEAFAARDVRLARGRPHVEYRRRPLAWMHDKMGVPMHTLRWALNDGYAGHAWDGTEEPLVAIAEGLANGEDVGVESGTGTGKSFLGAGLILWFTACWEGARTFTFAPSEDQLRKYIWTEIGKMWPAFQRHFPAATLTDLTLRMRGGIDDSWGAWGRTAAVRAGEEVSTRTAGMHAPHMLIVTEETPGIHPSVMEAIKNTCTASHNLRLALGNPDHQLDPLHLFCAEPGVRHVRVSALDHPNVVAGDEDIVPGAVSRKSVGKRLAEYGEDGRLYQSRVRGLSPAESQDALIRLQWLEAAALRYETEELRLGAMALGVDVANSESGDLGAISIWQGACLLDVKAFPCPDANVLGAQVHALMMQRGISRRHVGVDKGGVGAGTVNELRRLGEEVIALDSALKSGDGGAERYLNLRAHMAWQLRVDLQRGRIAMKRDPKLFRELTMLQYETKNGVIRVQPKEEIRKNLGGRSPDRADAVIYGNWVRDRSPAPPAPKARENAHPGFVTVAGSRHVVAADAALAKRAAAPTGAVRVPAPVGRGVKVPR